MRIHKVTKMPGSPTCGISRTQNFHEGIAETVNGACRIKTSSGSILYSNDKAVEGPVTFGIRPEEIALISGENSVKSGNHIKARVAQIRFRPSCLEVELDAGFPLIAYDPWHRDSSNRIAEGG